MDENAAASLALDAAQTLEGIGEDVAQIRGQNSDVLAAIESLRQTGVEGFQQLIARDASQRTADEQEVKRMFAMAATMTRKPYLGLPAVTKLWKAYCKMKNGSEIIIMRPVSAASWCIWLPGVAPSMVAVGNHEEPAAKESISTARRR